MKRTLVLFAILILLAFPTYVYGKQNIKFINQDKVITPQQYMYVYVSNYKLYSNIRVNLINANIEQNYIKLTPPSSNWMDGKVEIYFPQIPQYIIVKKITIITNATNNGVSAYDVLVTYVFENTQRVICSVPLASDWSQVWAYDHIHYVHGLSTLTVDTRIWIVYNVTIDHNKNVNILIFNNKESKSFSTNDSELSSIYLKEIKIATKGTGYVHFVKVYIEYVPKVSSIL